VPRATGLSTGLSKYEEAWEAINRLIRRGGSWSGHERDCFFVQGEKGKFHNVSAVYGLDAIEDGRGLAVLDLDRDGDQDLCLKSRTAPQLRLWRNDLGGQGARITFELAGTTSNRGAVGARVTVRAGGTTRVKEVCAGSGFLSQSSPRLHFGLGGAARVDEVRVRWPSGGVQSFRDLAVNRAYSLREGEEKLAVRSFEPPSRHGAPAVTFEPPAAAPAPGGTIEMWLIEPCPLPDLAVTGADGGRLALDRFRGRPLLLHLWSPECPRCLTGLEEWARDRGAGGRGDDLRVLGLTRREEAGTGVARAVEAAARSGLETAFLDDESLLALGVLIEDIAHWPRDLPVPSSLLLDADGRIVKLHRGPVALEKAAADARAIPSTPEARLARALPFPGKYHSTDLVREAFQLGVSYLELGLEQHAARAFERSLVRRPRQADAIYNLGFIRAREGDVQGAAALYARALEEAPDFADARVNLGVLLAREGRLDAAAEEFERVLALRADHVEALMNLGNVELSRGRHAEAIRAFSRAAAADPALAHARKRLGDACRRAGDVEGARKAYEEATALDPGDAEAWSNLGVILAEGGKLEEALAACEKGIAADPKHASSRNNAGLILQGLGRAEEAVERFRKAIDLAPDLPAPRLNLARALLRAGDPGGARKALEGLLERHPGHPAALELLKRVGG
jgi:tetratricopeptide (TPR) repeat protein